MPQITQHTVTVNGIAMHVTEAGEGSAVVLLHGFPELAFSWRHQMTALAEAGYRAIAPDIRGHGRTDAPVEVEAYGMRTMMADITGLMDALEVSEAVVVGHDQGALLAWALAEAHPERVRAIIALGVPYHPKPPMPLTQMLAEHNPGKFNVVSYFQQPRIPEQELEADVRATLLRVFAAQSGDAEPDLVPRWLTGTPAGAGFLDALPMPDRLPYWLKEDDLDYYTAEYERTGFTGTLNRYRSLDADWFDLPELGTGTITRPALYITGDMDSAYRLGTLEPMKARLTDLRSIVILPGCGHWTQQERPHAVKDQLIAFLNGLDGTR
ncbi:alpha/beta fold hydrolase [Actinomadura litoris]|uniref:alpha/beta fold hydrolase n=1 Tax=Actinomadura litoris TaxID=2678616 RepID=UPI001FA7085E|nr:alpha/beta hydrolase [Actinomadura litoris]